MGYEAVALQNESLRITVLPGKGTDILEFLYKPLDIDFLWLSYSGLRPVGSINSNVCDPSGVFLDNYPGGWQEVLPNFGEPCVYKGGNLGQHGEVAILPWKYTVVLDEPTCVSVKFSVRCVRAPYLLTKTMTLHPGPVLVLDEYLVNESSEDMDCMWGHHPAFGGMFLDETCQLHLPPCRVRTPDEYTSPNARLERKQDCRWPMMKGCDGETVDLSRIPPPSSRSHDMAFLYDFQEGWYAITNPTKNVGFALAWDSRVFRYLWYWQVFRGWSGYPWYGMTYNIGLEPCTSYPPPLSNAIQHNTQLRLGPGETIRTKLSASVFTNIEKVSRVTLDGHVSQE